MKHRSGPNPYAFVPLESALAANQPYSVALSIALPRSPTNVQAGNFMLDLSLLSPSYKPGLTTTAETPVTPFVDRSTIPSEYILFNSRRPTLLTYQPPLISLSRQLWSLPLHILGVRKRDAEVLSIPMAETVSFSKGWRNIPNTVYVEVQIPSQELNKPGHGIEVYEMNLKLRARFEGLRWIMYNHRITSFLVFTTAFWIAEVLVAALTWFVWFMRMKETPIKAENGVAIKKETGHDDGMETDDLDLSDTPRSFPTYGRQAPLRYTAPIKNEEDEVEEDIIEEAQIQPLDADDESEEPIDVGYAARGGRSDSGIGTSFSEGGEGSRGLTRRKSRGGRS